MSYECCKRITLDKKNNKIKVCIASNNLRPLTYETYEIYNTNKFKDYTFDEKLLYLFFDMISGNIQVTNLNDNTEKFEYGLCKAREYIHKQDLGDLWDKKSEVYWDMLYKKANIIIDKEDDYKNNVAYRQWRETQNKEEIEEFEDKCFKKAIIEVYGEPYKVFKKALEEKIEGDYKVVFNNYYVVTKLGKYDRGFSRFSYANKTVYDFNRNMEVESVRYAKMSFKKAYIFCKDMGYGNKRTLEIVKV